LRFGGVNLFLKALQAAERAKTPGIGAMHQAMALVLVLTVFCLPPAHARPDNPDDLLIRHTLASIDSLLAVPDLEGALAAATTLQEKHGENLRHGWQIESRLGLIYLRQNEPANSLPHLEKAIGLAPNKPQNHRNLGAALLKMGRRGRALSEYAQAVELAPDDGQLRLEYGQLLLQFGDLPRAQAHLEVARRLCNDCLAIQKPLGRLYLATNRFAEAAAIIEPLYRENPSEEGLRRSLIQAWQGAGRDSLLLGFLGDSLAPGMPRDEATLLVGLEGRLGVTNWSEAFAQVVGDTAQIGNQVPQAVVKDSDFWGQISYNLLMAGKNRLALAAIDRAIELDGNQVTHRNNRVVLLTRLGRHDEARQEWEKVLDLDPSLEEKK